MKTELMNIPKCPVCNVSMVYQTPRTYEQRFVGAMYTCPNNYCQCSALIPSKELLLQLEGQKKRAK